VYKKIPHGYCPQCRQHVLLVREDIDWMLAILLICFSCGLGLIIYLIIYYGKPENRCVHCYTIVEPQAPSVYQQPPQPYEVPTPQPYEVPTPQPYEVQTPQNQVQTTKEEKKGKFCPYCGEEVVEGARFCQGCGAKVI